MITMEINGQPFENFLSVSIDRAVDTFCGTFSFTASSADSTGFPIPRGSRCKILINNHPVVTGWVESIDPTESASDHTVSIKGRDVTCDILDSTLLASSVELSAGSTLEQAINKVQSFIGLSLPIVNNTSGIAPFSAFEIVAAKAGDGAFDFLEKLARKRQVFLTTNGTGAVVITQAGTAEGSFALTNLQSNANNQAKGEYLNNTVLNSSATYDDSKRFNRYIVSSQGNMSGLNNGGVPDLDTLINSQSVAVVDADIRATRVMVIVAENSSDPSEGYKRAQWEANIRKARSRIYTATVDGIAYADGTPFENNVLLQVNDDAAGIYDLMLIKSISQSVSVSGSTTTFEMMEKNALTLELSEPVSDKGAGETGFGFDIGDDSGSPTEQDQLPEAE